MFFHSFVCYFCAIIIATAAQKKFRIIQKSRSCGRSDIIILTNTLTMSPDTPMCEIPCDMLRKLRAEFVHDNDIIEIGLLHVHVRCKPANHPGISGIIPEIGACFCCPALVLKYPGIAHARYGTSSNYNIAPLGQD